MKQQQRLALEFFLPPLLASLPFAARAAFSVSEYNRVVLVCGLILLVYMAGCIPALVSASVMEYAFKLGLNPRGASAIGVSALLGLLGGIGASKTFLGGRDLGWIATLGVAAWGATGLVVAVGERRFSSLPNQSSDPTLASVTPPARQEPRPR
jgi:hypothetical protein